MVQPVVEVREGMVSGTVTDGVAAFRGIPYAASPAGDLRFRPPSPHPAWDGVRDGSRPGPSAPQGKSRLEAIMGPREPDWDENGCLNLNVWTPGAALTEGTRPRPVLVWFHGGAWSSGSGGWDWYDGGRLAAAGGIVVVTANYRLGPLGYLWLPGPGAGAPDGNDSGADNLGSRDQAAVLTWVRDNIAAFGGDPGAITVGGQSAGAYSALASALDPATSDLVRRVILQSGPWGMRPRHPGDAAEITSEYLGILGIDPDGGDVTTRLRRVPVPDLLAAARRLTAERAQPGDATPLLYPVVSGAGLPRPWQDALRDGGLGGKQVLIGSTAHEMTAFLGPMRDGESADRQARATDDFFGAGVTEIAAACAAQGIPAYAYRFTRASTADPALGASHCADLPFMFGNLGAYENALMLGPVSDADRALAHEVTTAFASFAAAGVPDDGQDPSWPAYEPGGHIRVFGPSRSAFSARETSSGTAGPTRS
jgi:para-nitrobenzyl esterase